MNVTFAVGLVIAFSVIGDILTWICRKDKTFIFGYISLIRIMVIWLAICMIYCIHDERKDYQFLNEANSFKYELLQHQDSLIQYQRTMIDNLADHLWNEHDCDIPQFDGDLKDKIDSEEEYIDSLYNTQL